MGSGTGANATWPAILERRFGVAIDRLEDALRTCPDALWEECLWEVRPEDPSVVSLDRAAIQVYSAFWYLAYHALFFLDLYLSGGLEQLDSGFAAPPPFSAEEHGAGVPPARVYTRPELEAYLAHGRRKCAATFAGLTDDQARRPVRLVRREVPFAELLLINLGHVLEHGAQLGMFLGQRVP